MENLIKKLAKLSFFKLSDREISSFKEDFLDIIPLIDKISDFPSCEEILTSEQNYNSLRPDVLKDYAYDFETKTVPRVIQ